MKILDIGKRVCKVMDPQYLGITKKIRIAVLGSKYAGKTVLLAALDRYMDRLLNTSLTLWEKGECEENAEGWGLLKKEDMPDRRHRGWLKFSKKKYHEKMEGNDWPERTLTPAVLGYKLVFAREGKIRRYEVELLDIPGERVADVVTMWNKSYDEWSDGVEEEYKKVNEEWNIYLEKVRKSGGTKELILEAYTEFLAQHLRAYSFFVTPSEAMLDRHGDPIDEMGLSEDSSVEEWRSKMNSIKFAPIPFDIRKDKSFIGSVKEFRKEYEKYKKESRVDEIKKWCITSSQVYYLVDVLGTLERGKVGVESTKRQVRLATVGVADKSFLTRMFSPNLRKFCAVATQVDRCGIEGNRWKENKSRLEEWLSEYFSKANTVAFKKGVFCTLVCSAVSSTRPVKEENGVLKCEGVKGFMKDANKPFSDDNCRHGLRETMSVPSVDEAEKKNYEGYAWQVPFPSFPHDGNFLHYNLDKIVASMIDLH